MDVPDGVGADRKDTVIMAQVLTPADPDNMRIAFDMLLNGVIDKAGPECIIDWGTTEFATQRAISDITGQELVYFMLGVRALDAL
jgi:hypothetical protein